ncbi:MAG: flagellar biosynthesis protein FlhB [Spirochaetes bacterium]|nr:flagellar biosynthesis protein FlhB [Spirochaetota bacterium]
MIEVIVVDNETKNSSLIAAWMFEEQAKDVPFVHLQWFAPEDEGKTEDPTEHKLRKAREEEGKVAKTSELAPALVIIFSVTVIAFLSRHIFNTLANMLIYFFSVSTEVDVTSSSNLVPVFFMFFLQIYIPIAIIAFIASLMGGLMQVGFLFTTKPITPDISKIAPNFPKWFKRAMFSTEAVFNLGKTMVKIFAIGLIAFLNIRLELNNLLLLSDQTLLFSLRYIFTVAFKIIIQAAVLLLLLSFPDYLFQKRQHKESLKMSRHDIKEEMKQLEGDPRVKNMLEQRMKELLSQNISKNVPLSDVVITNPTHYSIAIKYDRFTMNAPSVSAKGKDEVALKIREIAKENDVPIMENKPLARALYTEVAVGDEIPVKYWEAVSIILSEVYKLTGKTAV